MIYGDVFIKSAEIAHNNDAELNESMSFFDMESSNYLLEYEGNAERNQEFMECLKDLDEVIKLYIKRIDIACKAFDKMMALYMTINSKNLLKVNNEIRNAGRGCNKELMKDADEVKKKCATTWRKFDKLARSFSVKYSGTTMQEKEKFSKRLEPYVEKLDKILEKYDVDVLNEKLEKKAEDVIKACELNGQPYKYKDDLIDVLNSWYVFIKNECRYTIGDIKYINKKMGNPDNPIFKLLNKDYQKINSMNKKLK